jgi:hypothetical protein
MSVHHGNDGYVKVGSNAVAEVQKWTYSEKDISLQSKSSMGDTSESYLPSGCKGGEGSVECLLDEADTNGQNALTPGASVTLNLFPDGDQSGDTQYSGTAIIEAVDVASDKASLNMRSFTFKGVLTRSTVA